MSKHLILFRTVAAAFLIFTFTIICVAEWSGYIRSLPDLLADNSLAQNKLSSFVTIGVCNTAGPIEIESTGGTTVPTAYATLGAAFTAVNAGTHTGTINIEVCGDTSEGAATATLNASGSGSASYASISIKPAGGAARTISGATTAGNPTINLNGADQVTIDGLNTNGNSLTIQNTTASNAAGTSTIRFMNDAQFNTITNSTILGASSMTVATNGGTIFFNTKLAGGTGNDNNTISNNNIGPVGTGLPTRAIYSSGTTSVVADYNSNNTITGNNIFDFFSDTLASAGIYLSVGTTDWTITNNRLYQTAVRTQTAAFIHAGIQLASSNINNCTISGNTIGYSSSGGTGTYSFVGSGTSSRFYPIYLSGHGTIAATNIQGNTITAISVSGPLSGTTSSAPFAAIMVAAGIAHIGTTTGNIIGSSSTGGAISFVSPSVSNSDVYGILFTPTQSANIANNLIGGITATNSSTGGVDLYGIRVITSSNFINTISNNTVGYSAAPIVNNASSASSHTGGIYSQAGVSIVTGNTVSNLTMAAGSGSTGVSAPMLGLVINNTGASGGNDISGNIIRNLTTTDTVNNNVIAGIAYNGPTPGTSLVQRNYIYGLSVGNSLSTNGDVSGIYILAGTTVYQNNMIALSSGVSAGNGFSGFNETTAASTNDSFYHNSVYIGGAGAIGTRNTFAMNSTIVTNNREYRDNIFYNARSNGVGTGKHYAVRMGGTGTNPGGLMSNNNIYLASGTGGVFGLYNGTDRTNLGAWRTAIGQDVGSFESNPQFIDPANATPNLHIHPANPTLAEGNGLDVAVTDDFDQQTRSSLTPVDIGADAGNFVSVSPSPGSLQFSSATYTIGEAGPTAILTVTRTGGSSGSVSASYSVTGGTATGGASCGALPNTTDYVNTGGTMSFANGDTTPQTINVPICSDVVFEGDETFGVTLSGPTGSATIGSPSVATVTITDDDAAPSVSIDDVTMNEGDSGTTNFIFTVSRTGNPSQAQINIAYHTADGSAAAPGDYAAVPSGTAIIPALGSSTTITILANGDTSAEPDETFSVILDSTSIGMISDNTGVGIITNDEVTMQFSSATYSGPEGTTAMITVNRTGNISGTSTVQYSGSGASGTGGSCSVFGSDYQPASGTLTFGPNDTSKAFSVMLCNDSFSENPADTVGLTLSSPSGGLLGSQSAATLSILDVAYEFANAASIATVNGTTANPYPSTINVSGYTGSASGVRVTLNGVTHSNPDDLDILLVSPGGQSFILMSDAGGGNALSNATITFEDTASVFLPDSSTITDGQNYKPTSCGSAAFPAPAPAVPYNNPGCGSGSNSTLASTFGGFNPNGIWSLYVVDDGGGFSPLGTGQIAGGWSIQFLVPTAAAVSVSGRILTAGGAGIRNATVTISGAGIGQKTVQTGAFGYYGFRGLESARSYIIAVATKRYRIAQPVRVVLLNDDMSNVDFVADP